MSSCCVKYTVTMAQQISHVKRLNIKHIDIIRLFAVERFIMFGRLFNALFFSYSDRIIKPASFRFYAYRKPNFIGDCMSQFFRRVL